MEKYCAERIITGQEIKGFETRAPRVCFSLELIHFEIFEQKYKYQFDLKDEVMKWCNVISL